MSGGADTLAVQARFVEAILCDATDVMADIAPGKLGAEKRLAIYRHNVGATLAGALGDIYPVVKHLVGDAFFAELARGYVVAHPSASGDLNRFGESLPLFLASYPHAVELPYLADVGRVEWACHTAFHAADAEPLTLAQFAEALAGIPPEQLGEVVLEVQPALQLMASEFPVGRIWILNQEELLYPAESDDGDWSVDLTVAESVAVYREGFEVVVKTLAPATFAFLASLKAGQSLGMAAEAALAGMDADAAPPDLQGIMAELVQSGIVIQTRLPQ